MNIKEGSPGGDSATLFLLGPTAVKRRVGISHSFFLRLILFLLFADIKAIDGPEKAGSGRSLSWHSGPAGLRSLSLFLLLFLILLLELVFYLLMVLLLLLITGVLYVVVVLEVQLPPLQIDVVDIEIVLMQLHVDHFLPLLVHLVLAQTLVDLVYLLHHLRAVLDLK